MGAGGKLFIVAIKKGGLCSIVDIFQLQFAFFFTIYSHIDSEKLSGAS